MVKVGDRIRLSSGKGPDREGDVTAVIGSMVRVRWPSGGETTMIPAPGSVSVLASAGDQGSPAVRPERAVRKKAVGKAVAKEAASKKAAPKKAVGKAVAKEAASKKAAPKKAAAKAGAKKATTANKAVSKKSTGAKRSSR